MREIKFRAWMEEDKKMFYFSWHFGRCHGNVLNGKDDVFRPIMQYTGLKDKNGKEIYEGDVVETEYGIQEVKYESDLTGDDMRGSLAIGFHFGGNEEFLKVIGNIYENHDLL